MIRVGLLGCGFMGNMHAACYAALADLDVKLTAVSDQALDAAQALAEKTGAAAWADAQALVESDAVDVIDICLPTFLHTPFAVSAMRAGKDVFIEKPVCLREEDMALLLETERQTGRKVQVGQVLRFWNEYVWLKRTADEGIYGKFLGGMFRRMSSSPTWSRDDWYHKPERSGGLAVDMHVHDVDFVRWLLGEPETVRAQAQRAENGVISQIFSEYTYPNGVGVSLEASWENPPCFPFAGDYRVRFERAAAVYEKGVLRVYPAEGEPFTPEFAAVAQESDAGGNISSLAGYYDELKYFIEGVRGEHALERAALADSIGSVRLVQREIETAGGLVLK